MWINFNINPKAKRVGDCAVRAIARALDKSWDDVFLDLNCQGLIMADMPSSNAVWGAYLKRNGWERHVIPSECPECYTVQDFCKEHPTGLYILALSGHVICAENGNYYDTWDSGQEYPIYYWQKGEN